MSYALLPVPGTSSFWIGSLTVVTYSFPLMFLVIEASNQEAHCLFFYFLSFDRAPVRQSVIDCPSHHFTFFKLFFPRHGQKNNNFSAPKLAIDWHSLIDLRAKKTTSQVRCTWNCHVWQDRTCSNAFPLIKMAVKRRDNYPIISVLSYLPFNGPFDGLRWT